MNIKTILLFCVLASTLLFSGSALSNGNNEASEFIFQKKCSRCHGLEKITQTAKTRDEWNATVKRMREKDTQWISIDEARIIATYLASRFAGNDAYQGNQPLQLSIPSDLPELFGVITFCLLIITVVIGFLMTHGKRKLFKTHKTMAYITLASGVIHGILILMTH